MSFLHPAVLVALLVIPLLIAWYVGQQRRRGRAAAAFAAPVLSASVAPRRPRWRRHVPMLAFALALAVLIVAAARPQRTVAEPVDTASIMLANDTSGSMAATDVAPSRLAAAEKAANRFLAKVPGSVRVGLLEFNTTVALLQSPTTDHALVSSALAQLRVTGGTAIGDALRTALHTLATVPKEAGKKPPGAILLLSDGASDVGSDPITAAQQAAAAHIPIYTVDSDADETVRRSAATRRSRCPCRRPRRSSPRSPASRTGRRSPPPTRRASTPFTSASVLSLGTRRSSTRSPPPLPGAGSPCCCSARPHR